MTVELVGLEVFGHHGATEEERALGRMLYYDLAWEVDADALDDRLERTVDYEQVAALVREVSDGRRFNLLEALAAAVADAVIARFPVTRLRVRVRKSGIRPAGLGLEHSAATVERTRSRPTRAFVGLGSNLGEREAELRRALDLLDATVGVNVVRVSSFRETEPVGYTDQPDFVNAAAEIQTSLDARGLLDALLAVERELGRERTGPRFGPRTIDLDLLLFGDEVVDEPGLTIPHPRLHERRFALEPLAELDGRIEVPGRGPVATLLAGL